MELPDYARSLAVRRDQKHFDPFSRDKLLISLHKALGHRATASNDASALCATIIGKLLKSPRVVDGIITKQQIVQTCLDTLKRFDAAAATTYRAYHANFS